MPTCGQDRLAPPDSPCKIIPSRLPCFIGPPSGPLMLKRLILPLLVVAAPLLAGEPTPQPGASTFRITEEQRKFWSFQPMKAATPPAVKDKSWPCSDLARFILPKLEETDLRPPPRGEH